MAHPALGQAVGVVVTPKNGVALEAADIVAACRATLPAYMVPAVVDVREGPLPRNPNGKIDRRLLATQFESTQA
ncbi:MAG TPA: hypothetical protein VFU90_15930 [Candidatus Tumulicola sp.]|nr:hypothetical protein [Candidatus Tumulicola sp.]